MRVGLVGAGNIAQSHYDAVRHAGGETVAVCTRGDGCVEFAKANNISGTYHSVKEMLQSEKLDAIFVLTQPSSFKAILEEIKPFDTPTFLEKPTGYTAEEAESLIPLLPSKVYVGLNRRFYSNIQKIRKELEGQKDLFAQLIFPERVKDYDYRDENSRNYWPMMNTIHGIDLFSYLVGWPTEIKFQESWGDIDCSIIKQFYTTCYATDKGNKAMFASNYDSPGGWRINIFMKQKEIIIAPFEKVTIKDMTGMHEIPFDAIDEECKPGFARQTEIFFEGIKSDKLPSDWVSYQDSLKSMRSLEQLM